jgi:uncharacterized protein (TIGR02271 family)
MISLDQAREIRGGTAMSTDGDRLGKIGQVYLDDQIGQPEWATVSTGPFGGRESFVPLALAEVVGTELEVPYDRDMLKGAPNVEAEGGHLSQREEAELYTYYGLDYSEADTDGTGPDPSGRTTEDAMTRAEERLNLDTVRQEVGRARLHKYIVTKQQTLTVPVTREQIRIEREPITAADIADATTASASGGPTLREEEHEIVLHAERAVVDKLTVPVERVRLDTDVVTDSQTVTADIRKERIEVHGVDTPDVSEERRAADTVGGPGMRTDERLR